MEKQTEKTRYTPVTNRKEFFYGGWGDQSTEGMVAKINPPHPIILKSKSFFPKTKRVIGSLMFVLFLFSPCYGEWDKYADMG